MAKESDANVSARPKMKRVAGNSVLLFIRFLALAVINLYSVRLMIVALGQDDYGLYNTLAGVVTVCVVIVCSGRANKVTMTTHTVTTPANVLYKP